MRYDYEFKKECVALYHEGKYPPTPEGVPTKSFRRMVHEWVCLADLHGVEILRHRESNLAWSPDDKWELVQRVLAGASYRTVATSAGMNCGLLYQWVRKYKIEGYAGLCQNHRGRPPKELSMQKDKKTTPLTESEREELIRLREENEYMRTEIAVIKKKMALRKAKQAAQQQAKKQQSSNCSESKDSD